MTDVNLEKGNMFVHAFAIPTLADSVASTTIQNVFVAPCKLEVVNAYAYATGDCTSSPVVSLVKGVAAVADAQRLCADITVAATETIYNCVSITGVQVECGELVTTRVVTDDDPAGALVGCVLSVLFKIV